MTTCLSTGPNWGKRAEVTELVIYSRMLTQWDFNYSKRLLRVKNLSRTPFN